MNESQQLSGYGQRLEAMQELMEEVLTLQRDGLANEEAVSRVKEIVQQSETIVENLEQAGAPEMLIDAKILVTGSRIVKHHVHSFDTNLKSFDPDMYTSGIIAFVESRSLQSTCDWDVLSAETFSLIKKVPSLNYKLGTFKLDILPPPEKEKTSKQKKSVDAPKSTASVVEQSGEAAQMTDQVYNHILKCLVFQYRQNKRQPINYFQFVIDPNDFWLTVKNIFHFSFLVRDGKVKMTFDDRGIPIIAPTPTETVADGQSLKKNSQFNFRITPGEWRKFIEIFDVKQACITPLKDT